jgi:hypothetical protein
MRKFDPATKEIIDDKRIDGFLADRHERRSGHWRAEMIALPLVNPVRELPAGEVTYPNQRSPYAKHLNDDERASAGFVD